MQLKWIHCCFIQPLATVKPSTVSARMYSSELSCSRNEVCKWLAIVVYRLSVRLCPEEDCLWWGTCVKLGQLLSTIGGG